MSKRLLSLTIALATVLAAMLACGFSVSTADIEEAWLAADEAGTQRTTVFAQDATFYCIATLANAPDDTTVRAEWTAVEVENTEPNTPIDQSELTTGSGDVTFQLENDNLWPIGRYKVDLYLNDELDQTLEFEVQ